MTLIVETGVVIPNANTYVNVADFRAYASARGITVPAADTDGDLEIEYALIRAMDYLQVAVCYQGYKTDEANALEWPRSAVYFNSALYSDAAIPNKLIQAQILLTIEILNGVNIMPNTVASDYVIEETVGPITTKYANPSKTGIAPSFPMVDALLASLLGGNCGHSGFLTVFRA